MSDRDDRLEDRAPLKKRKMFRDDLHEEELDFGSDSDDAPRGSSSAPSFPSFFDLDARATVVPHGGWVPKAKAVAYEIKARVVSHVMWWDVQHRNPEARDMYPLPHLPFTHNTGVCPFHVDVDVCKSMASFLDDGRNYDGEGWLMLAGQPYPGYGKYPYVHAPLGQLSTIQQVCAACCACCLFHLVVLSLPMFCATAQDRACAGQDCLRPRPGS